MLETEEPSPKTYSVLEMLEILADFIAWRVDPRTKWETSNESITVGEMLERAQIVITREGG